MGNMDTISFILTCSADFEKWWKKNSKSCRKNGVDKDTAQEIFQSGYEFCAKRIKQNKG